MKRKYFEPIFDVEKFTFVQDLLAASAEDAMGSLDGEWGEDFGEDGFGDDFFG